MVLRVVMNQRLATTSRVMKRVVWRVIANGVTSVVIMERLARMQRVIMRDIIAMRGLVRTRDITNRLLVGNSRGHCIQWGGLG